MKKLLISLRNLLVFLVSFLRRNSKSNNHITPYRVINSFGKYIPQYLSSAKYWVDVPFNNSMWDNYSGRYTDTNAKQRLYVYMGKCKKDQDTAIYSVTHSIFLAGEVNNCHYYDFLLLNGDKNYIISVYNKYLGRTEFIKNIYPEFFN